MPGAEPGAVQLATGRVAYAVCPLCGGEDLRDLGEASCRAHPLWTPALPDAVPWRGCGGCGHVFTAGWFDDATRAQVLARTGAEQDPEALTLESLERLRHVCARIVTKVASVRGALDGRWLDVGIGNGVLLATAAEFGFEPLGLDLREGCVRHARALGLPARVATLEELDEGPFEVISLADVLEHVPFPRATLARARDLLAADGLLFVSMPNMDCAVWRELDRASANPYWGELEHFHNFTRERLYAALVAEGLQPCHYGVSERYRAGMEVVARRAAD